MAKVPVPRCQNCNQPINSNPFTADIQRCKECGGNYERVIDESPAVKDPLDLSEREIRKYRNQIIRLLMRHGRSRKSAIASVDRWEASLKKTQKEFAHITIYL